MTDRELARAAQQAVACIDDIGKLADNLLFAAWRERPHDELRAIVRDAVTSLAPLEPVPFSDKRRRLHEIVVRCDLRRESHKSVAALLGISRREFYRERRDALLRLANEIRRSIARPRSPYYLWGPVDLVNAAKAVVDTSRWAGQYETVWREACALAPRLAGNISEIMHWIVASEAATHLARPDDAIDALQKARNAKEHFEGERPQRADLWLALGEINLRWSAADFDGARAAFKRALSAADDELLGRGDNYAIMLAYVASMEFDCGNWELARSLLARASERARLRIDEVTRTFAVAGQSLLRLQAQLALRADGDVRGAVADNETALHADESSGRLGSAGLSAASYATALAEAGSHKTAQYAEYGLEIVRRYYHGDRLARITLELLPVLAREGGAIAAHRALSQVRRAGLGLRDEMLLDLAYAKMALYDGDYVLALERAQDVQERLTRCGMHAWACEAQLIGVEASVKLDRRDDGGRRLAMLSERIEAATAQTRSRARALAKSLDVPTQRQLVG